jgi:hypothetical protein
MNKQNILENDTFNFYKYCFKNIDLLHIDNIKKICNKYINITINSVFSNIFSYDRELCEDNIKLFIIDNLLGEFNKIGFNAEIYNLILLIISNEIYLSYNTNLLDNSNDMINIFKYTHEYFIHIIKSTNLSQNNLKIYNGHKANISYRNCDYINAIKLFYSSNFKNKILKIIGILNNHEINIYKLNREIINDIKLWHKDKYLSNDFQLALSKKFMSHPLFINLFIQKYKYMQVNSDNITTEIYRFPLNKFDQKTVLNKYKLITNNFNKEIKCKYNRNIRKNISNTIYYFI